MIELSRQEGDIHLALTAIPMGKDWLVALSGGDAPHIGAVALAHPRPSLKGDGSASATASVLALTGHKEDMLAREVALRVARECGVVACVSCGIHMESATEGEIDVVLRLTDDLVMELVAALK